MKNTSPRPWVHSAVVLCTASVLLALAGCGQESETKLLDSAKEFIAKNDHKSAIIQLKSALQANPNSGETRFLLGKAMRETGDNASALLEIRKAQDLGYTEELVLPELAKAMLAAGEGKQLAAQFADTTLKDPAATADLSVTVAMALASQKETGRALELSNRALQAVPGYTPAVVLQAQLKAADGDLDGALFLLNEVLAKKPDDLRAGLLRAELLWAGKRQSTEALAAFRKVLESHPKSVVARLGAINLLFESAQVDAARTELAELVKVAPQHPDTLFQQARLAFRDKQYPAAKETLDRILKSMPNNVPALELAGATEFQLRNDAQAEAHLGKVLKLAPNRRIPRHLLAQIFTRGGQPQRAIETLTPLMDGPQADGVSLALAGEAYLQLGEPGRADAAFQRATKAAPQDPRVRTSAAMAQLSRGQSTGSAAAMAELESLASADTQGSRADVALIAGKLQQKDLPGALKAVAALQKKMPENPLPLLLQGRVLALKGDTAGARAALEAALSKDAKYFPAVATLASMDLSAKQPDAARQRFEALLKADPRNHRAHLALAELAARTQAPAAEVTRLLGEAVKAAPAEIQPRVMLVAHLQRQGDHKAALTAAQDALAALPNSVEVMETAASAQLAAGDAQQGLSSMKKAAALQPQNAELQLRLADAYRANKDVDGTRAALRRALELKPGLVQAWQGLVGLAVNEKKFDVALGLARDLQKQQPQAAAGYLLEGNVEASRQAWPAAITALKAARQRARQTETTIVLHQTLLAAGQRAEADKLAAEWQREQPKDAAFAYYLGDQALARKELPAAESHYKAVLALQPENALAMNNLAWLMAQQGRPGAVDMATKANTLLPGRAPLLDTLATALAAEGQVAKAIETQKQALQLAPKDNSMQLGLAKLHLKAGDKAAARGLLQELSKLGEGFGAHKEVAELLKAAA
jgi:putative PEP-CTERM system TPR-repeat lipoprotein